MIALLALVVGIVLGLVLEPTIPAALQPYLPIAVVAALDAVFGASRALFWTASSTIGSLSSRSSAMWSSLGSSSFLVTSSESGAQLSTGVVVVFSIRIFANAAAIRRHLFHA